MPDQITIERRAVSRALIALQFLAMTLTGNHQKLAEANYNMLALAEAKALGLPNALDIHGKDLPA